jgi:hypothetical protein
MRDLPYDFLEALIDIAYNVGFMDGKGRIKDLDKVGGSRAMVEWIMKKGEEFYELTQDVKWGLDEEWGEYIEVIDDFTVHSLKALGMVAEEKKDGV